MFVYKKNVCLPLFFIYLCLESLSFMMKMCSWSLWPYAILQRWAPTHDYVMGPQRIPPVSPPRRGWAAGQPKSLKSQKRKQS